MNKIWVLTVVLFLAGCSQTDQTHEKTAETSTEQPTTETPTTEEATTEQPQKASNTTTMKHLDNLAEGPITPKSVVANGKGQLIANNMMYQHTVTLYDAKSRKLTQKLSDKTDLSDIGIHKEVSGAPVEAVWTKDGQYAYVSQYQLTDMGAEAEDECVAGNAIQPSAVYRYSLKDKDWDQVIQVGRVPKYVALTPDNKQLLVSNWCDKSLSVVDTATVKETKKIPLNSMPRGIVTLKDNNTAYVTAMFANEIYRVNLKTGKSEVALKTGNRPRHLVIDDQENLYLTVAGANELVKMDHNAKVLARTQTGQEPRSMTISQDNKSLYVVNYNEDTASKFDAATLITLQKVQTGHMPIGITYEPTTHTVWVANYSGSLDVFTQ
ncbi:YncE family protein [Macrococcus brunensis]|uniref:YncE family protein n=1 Tax=Macrococcus brunensis TaxID=198483 RepID=UPI001EF05CF1|nr:beta-propeller fold lactonase family protein [Macrococcus brunensis]ULG72690.1 beta-propeller fold lactonase family protein [Macrococcus brunensis]